MVAGLLKPYGCCETHDVGAVGIAELDMIQIRTIRDQARLRRIALRAQGLLHAKPFGRGLSGAQKTIGHLGYVQIDTISVVERAHHHVLFSRVPGFDPEMTNRLLRNRSIFEYWAHAAAFLPIEDFRYSLPYKQAIRDGQVHWFRPPDANLMARLYDRIYREGPLRARDLETSARKTDGWWDWKPAKKALEHMYMRGDLMVSDRDGFQKTYDLTERVLPSDVDTTMPTSEEFALHLLDQQLRCHGLVSQKGVTYLRRNAPLRDAVSALVSQRLATGELVQVQVPSGERFLAEPAMLEAPVAPVRNQVRILSPFDNTVIQRERLRALFQFDYQIECYLPASKRRYGYFSLPLLYRDQFIGRMDCKAHRASRHLEIVSLHFERHGYDADALFVAFAEAMAEFCQFQGCDTVELNRAYPSTTETPLRRVLERQVAGRHSA